MKRINVFIQRGLKPSKYSEMKKKKVRMQNRSLGGERKQVDLFKLYKKRKTTR